MVLTDEERQALLLARSEAKVRCKEVYGTILELKKLLRSYGMQHTRWLNRHDKADRALAEHDKLTVVTVDDRRKQQTSGEMVVKFSQEQIRQIAAELGLSLEGGDTEDES